MSKFTNTDHSDNLIDTFVDGDSKFEDNFQTREQKARDCEITKLLRQYVTAYAEKRKIQRRYRTFLFIICSSIILLFSIAFLCLLICFCFNLLFINVGAVVSLISFCITFLISVLGLTQIITNYCFPQNDEEYITRIVETIQANDLSHKLTNIKTSLNVHTLDDSQQ